MRRDPREADLAHAARHQPQPPLLEPTPIRKPTIPVPLRIVGSVIIGGAVLLGGGVATGYIHIGSSSEPSPSGPTVPGGDIGTDTREVDIPGRNLDLVRANPRIITWAKTLPTGMFVEISDEGPDGATATVVNPDTGGVRIRELPTKTSQQVRSQSLNTDEVRDSVSYRYMVIVLISSTRNSEISFIVDKYVMTDAQNVVSANGAEYIDGNFVSSLDQNTLLMRINRTPQKDNSSYPMGRTLNPIELSKLTI